MRFSTFLREGLSHQTRSHLLTQACFSFIFAIVFPHWELIGWSPPPLYTQSGQMAVPRVLPFFHLYCWQHNCKEMGCLQMPFRHSLKSKEQINSAVWGETLQKQASWNNCFKQISSWRSIRQVLFPSNSVWHWGFLRGPVPNRWGQVVHISNKIQTLSDGCISVQRHTICHIHRSLINSVLDSQTNDLSWVEW